MGAPDLRGKHVCPFCGTVNAVADGDPSAQAAQCPRCSMADTPATRKATKARIGPWFVRQNRNPAAPGMRFDTLLALVRRGQVTAQSVVRGPTTHQLWRFAAQVKGLSRAFGVCYSCGGSVEPDATLCSHCNRMQEPPVNPDVLLETGLAPAADHQTIRKELRPLDPRPPAPAVPPARPAPPAPAAPAASAARPQPADIFTPDHPQLEHEHERMAAPSRREESQPRRSEREPRFEPRAQSPASQRPRPSPDADSAILSARDLAAAFQLDFKPNMRRRRKWAGKLVAALVLLVLAGVAAVLMTNEPLRRTVLTWGQRQYTTIREAVVNRAQPAPVAEAPANPPATDAGQPSDISPPRETLASHDVKPSLSAPATKPATASAGNRRPTAATTPAPSDSTGSRPRVEQPRPRPAPIAVTPAPQPPPQAPPQPAPIDPAVAADEARTLWRQAIDAEARQDFAAAVRHYEQIKRLPKSAWPGGLEINLELARQRLK
jgi:hypothetical protein